MAHFITTPAPHVHSGDSVRRNMLLVILALMPAYVVSVLEFGIGALITAAVSVAACVLIEWLISRFLLKESGKSIEDLSAALTGLLLAFNLPSSIDWWIVVLGALIAIGVGKMSFGGLGQNPFNPALVGRVFLLISFPVQMTSWPVPGQLTELGTDAVTGATPLAELAAGNLDAIPSATDLLLGNTGGSLGEVSALCLLLGLAFMLWRKIITWHIPVSILGTVAVFTAILWGVDSTQFANPLFHLLTGGMMLGACYMATDYVTSPMTHKGQIIYGICIGLLTMVIRLWGAYPEGMSFAILIMNAFTPLINNYCKPKRFGEVAKKGGDK